MVRTVTLDEVLRHAFADDPAERARLRYEDYLSAHSNLLMLARQRGRSARCTWPADVTIAEALERLEECL